YSTAFIKKAETVTDANGHFNIKFEQGDAVNYRLEFHKEKYFFYSLELNSNDIRPDIPYEKDIKIMPEANVKVCLINKNWFNERDVITISTFAPASNCDCCKNQTYTFTGLADTSFTCLLYGPNDYKLTWTAKRENHNNAGPIMKTFFCPALETTVFEIEY
ncbi:MAG: hypothetical protein H0X62_13870, partial [Bacteroidetes bacterium]|nr:hypothetical protein [Bacteroidota bacterium]